VGRSKSKNRMEHVPEESPKERRKKKPKGGFGTGKSRPVEGLNEVVRSSLQTTVEKGGGSDRDSSLRCIAGGGANSGIEGRGALKKKGNRTTTRPR